MSKTTAETAITKHSSGAGVQIIFGYILAIAFGVMALTSIAATGLKQPMDWIMVPVLLLLTALGIWMILRGKKRRRSIKLFREYAARLATDPLRSIDQLAAGMSASPDQVKQNLTEMISRGYFVNAYIDHDRNCLMFAHPDASGMNGSAPRQQGPQIEYVTVACSGCGATNKVPKGAVGECQYCGNLLSGN
jgi:ABC-type nickel/cobalt efflux system permease component RcnA